jgi:hypothetical protein
MVQGRQQTQHCWVAVDTARRCCTDLSGAGSAAHWLCLAMSAAPHMYNSSGALGVQ